MPNAPLHSGTASDVTRPVVFRGWPAVVVAATLVGALGAFCWRYSGTPTAQAVGDVSLFIAAVVATVSCWRAARLASDEKRAWTLIAVAATVYTLGQVVYTTYGFTRDHVYPFPSLADIGYLGFAVPAAAGLLLFPRTGLRRASRVHTVLDALAIALAVLFVSWGTVLGSVYQAGGADVLTRVTSLGYPIVDVLIASLVLALGMRRPAGQRLTWAVLGGGLVTLAVTDSIYVSLLNAGQTGLTGTPLAIGWVSAWLLIGLAPWVPRSTGAAEVRREAALVIELLPYVPVFLAILVSAEVVLGEDRFLQATGAILLVVVAARQVMIVFENVTLTRDLEAKVALRTTELAGMGAIVQASQDAILSKTTAGIVTTWNPGAERLYGWTAEEFVGRDVALLVPPNRREEEDLVLERVRRGEQVRTESERLRKDGSVVPVALTVSPIFDGDVVTGMASIQQDVTDRKAKDAALKSAREEALESSRLKSEFLATMSHEIRTPMNGVIGLTSLLLETPLDETQRQYAEGVQGAGEALLAVINDILDFSKLEAGKVDLEFADFDPRRLVDEVASLLAPTAQSKHLELIAYCQPDVPQRLVGDVGRLRQILLNLASNAVKFTAVGEVAIAVRSVDAGDGRPTLRFDVTDTGIGISQEAHARLFESFSQADASTTRRYGGTGLGLAISRRLTEAMGGTIGVDSDVGAGSTFWFQVPVGVGEPLQGADASLTLTPDLLDDLRVIVVDDNETNRLVLGAQLTGWGMRPEVVERPGSVVALMREAAAGGQPFAIAVLDMCMPEMDGVQLARQIFVDPTLSSTRMILLTSAMLVDRDDFAEAGVTEWLTKPVRSSEFYDRLMRLMSPVQGAALPPPVRRPSPLLASESLGRVLIVEDNALNQLVAEGVVTKLGYQVDIVANGAEGLDAIAATRYAAVLMDCHMPVLDGFAATEEIRRRENDGDRIPIIAMTAGAMAEDREHCLAVGMDDYVSKPVNVGAIRDALARWVPQGAPVAAPAAGSR
jgi:PAS domain S-box-containing protein